MARRPTTGPISGILVAAWLMVVATIAVGQQQLADVSPVLPADRLALTGIDGTTHDFVELLGADGRAVCFAFINPACPLAQEYALVLSNLAADFAGQGIRVVGVVCECDDSEETGRMPGSLASRSRSISTPVSSWPRRSTPRPRPRWCSWTATGEFATPAGSTTATRSEA